MPAKWRGGANLWDKCRSRRRRGGLIMPGKWLWLAMWIFVCGLLAVQLSPLVFRAFLYPHNTNSHYNRHRHTLSRGQEVDEDDFMMRQTERIWGKPNDLGFTPCVEPERGYSRPVESDKYLYVHCNGGLNQMRAGICDMVAIARIMNVTLVLPEVDKESFWQDESEFSDIFDEEYFMEALKGDVRIIKKLPDVAEHLVYRVPKGFQSWSPAEYYESEIRAFYDSFSVVKVIRSDARLANNGLPSDIQKLRCRVHYDALRFHPSIEQLGHKLVKRMQKEGPFIALHLRYEKDMLAFSGCTHDLSPQEAEELTQTRLETRHWRVKEINGEFARQTGTCPLTPKEVGLMLKAMGFPNSTIIYIAAGEIYGGETHMADLRTHFPRILRKETVATAEELAPFAKHQSRMAALDYIVAVESNVFIPTYSGNMARAVEGHRRFLGHRRTITPDRQGAPRVRRGPLPGTKGRDRARSEESFYENPLPDCLCQDPSFKRVLKSESPSWKTSHGLRDNNLDGGIWLTQTHSSDVST
eukprot:TRINITY_DN5217_c0_g1_i2.p1 TRINITY_DN5217_c0_g1~~TRINITY_DN5217_c0_g1_i2.p1  ORF type:complete len:526 (+),score=69.66 TRINITY_DN5217_c0_g1_i2:66-1643(+)